MTSIFCTLPVHSLQKHGWFHNPAPILIIRVDKNQCCLLSIGSVVQKMSYTNPAPLPPPPLDTHIPTLILTFSLLLLLQDGRWLGDALSNGGGWIHSCIPRRQNKLFT